MTPWLTLLHKFDKHRIPMANGRATQRDPSLISSLDASQLVLAFVDYPNNLQLALEDLSGIDQDS